MSFALLAPDLSRDSLIEFSTSSHSEGRDPPPGAVVATRAMAKDPRAEPEYGERVPYILYAEKPGTKQIDRSISPGEFLANPLVHFCTRSFQTDLMNANSLVTSDSTSITTSSR